MELIVEKSNSFLFKNNKSSEEYFMSFKYTGKSVSVFCSKSCDALFSKFSLFYCIKSKDNVIKTLNLTKNKTTREFKGEVHKWELES